MSKRIILSHQGLSPPSVLLEKLASYCMFLHIYLFYLQQCNKLQRIVAFFLKIVW